MNNSPGSARGFSLDAKHSTALVVALLASLAVLYLLCLRAYYVGFFNDDAFYLIGARSLLQGGGLRELNAPGAPPLLNYLPGYPLLLAQWAWLFGESTRAAQLLSVLLTLSGLALMWVLLSSELPAAVALSAVCVAGFNPLTASVSGAVLADLPYFALTPLVFLAAAAAWPRRQPWVWAGLGALCGVCFLVRPTGAAFVLALLLCLLAERRWSAVFWAAAGAAAAAGPWLLRNWLLSGLPLSHGAELAAPWRDNLRAGLTARLARNAVYYGPELFWRTLFRWPAWSRLETATVFLGLAALAAGLRAWGLRGWRKLLTVYAVLYAALHLQLHLQSGRYVFTFLPVAVPMIFLGAREADRRWRLRGALVPGLLALSAALSAAPVLRVARVSLRGHTPLNTPPERTVAWIRGETSPDDVLAADLDGRLHLLCGRRTVRLPKAAGPEAFHSRLRAAGAAYLLAAPNDGFMTTISRNTSHDPLPEGRLALLLSDRTRYEPVFADAAEGTAIYRVR